MQHNAIWGVFFSNSVEVETTTSRNLTIMSDKTPLSWLLSPQYSQSCLSFPSSGLLCWTKKCKITQKRAEVQTPAISLPSGSLWEQTKWEEEVRGFQEADWWGLKSSSLLAKPSLTSPPSFLKVQGAEHKAKPGEQVGSLCRRHPLNHTVLFHEYLNPKHLPVPWLKQEGCSENAVLPYLWILKSNPGVY